MSSLRDRILARPDLAEARAARDITALAAGLNADAPLVRRERYITARTILAECPSGPAILDALEATAPAVSVVKWALTFLGQNSGLDIGNPVTLALVDQLVAGGALTPTHRAELYALALAPELVTQAQVALEMYYPDGTER